MTLLVSKTRESAHLFTRATDGSAGLDLSACIEVPQTLSPNGSCVIPTGLSVAIPFGYVGLVFGRSGLGIRHGITLSNAVGVIDSDYRGEIMVGLLNRSTTPYTINPGERIAQLVLTPVLVPNIEVCDFLPETNRGAAGFGSTGR